MVKVNEYLQKVICDIVKPQKGVYLAFDGSVPRAKMIQQRYRRFKGVIEKKYKDELKEKHSEPSKFEFDKTKISPATEFMIKLNKSITDFIKSGGLYKHQKITIIVLSLFFIVQLVFPFRYALYPNELFWTEEGYRFSWRVMLMEKMGYANFKITNSKTGNFFYVDNQDFLTPLQEKQMSFQPDFILEYAHFLGDHFKSNGHENIQVFVESYVALNGRLSQPFINKNIDLYQQKETFNPKEWILPFNDEIKGF